MDLSRVRDMGFASLYAKPAEGPATAEAAKAVGFRAWGVGSPLSR